MRDRVIAGMLLVAALAAAQSPEHATEDEIPILTVESRLVIVPLHVYRKKTPVGGLTETAFELLEDGVEKEIAFVEGPAGPGEGPEAGRNVPVEIILLLDVSHSVMRRGLLDIETIRAGLQDGLDRNVRVSVYGFARKLTRFTGPTRNLNRIGHALELAYAAQDGHTRVFESVTETARDAAGRGGNASRMIVVFSDGLSTTDFDPAWTVRAATAFGIPVYPVVLGHRQIIERARRAKSTGPLSTTRGTGRGGRGQAGNWPPRQSRSASRAHELELRQQEFANLGRLTGGRSYDLKINHSKAIRSILESLTKLALTEYVVGYYPSGTGEEPHPRQVEVRLRDKGVGNLYGGRRVIVY